MTYLQREQYSQLRLSTCLGIVRRGDASCLRSDKNTRAREVADACTCVHIYISCVSPCELIYSHRELEENANA